MNILAIGAHHDDVELGAGGTLAKLVENGNHTELMASDGIYAKLAKASPQWRNHAQ